MKGKKKFFIPRNYDKKFEWVPGISGLQNLVFIPIAAIDYAIFNTPFAFENRLVAALCVLGLPYTLISIRPVRENVPMYQHLIWRFKFLTRQRLFHYKKEGYQYAIQVKEEHGTNTKRGATHETGAKSTKKHSRFNPFAQHRKRYVDNTGQKDGAMSKSVSN